MPRAVTLFSDPWDSYAVLGMFVSSSGGRKGTSTELRAGIGAIVRLRPMFLTLSFSCDPRRGEDKGSQCILLSGP